MELYKSTVNEIKKLMVQFGFLEKQALMDVVLQDGTKLNVEGDALVAGAKVMVVTEDGNIPAPDGQYQLEDGSTINIADGVIVESKQDETPVEQEQEMHSENELIDVLKTFVQNINERLNTIDNKFNSIENEFSEFKKQPSTNKIADGKTDVGKPESEVDARVRAIMEFRKNK